MDTHPSTDAADLLELSADVVAAYVSNNSLSASALAGFIGEVHAAFQKLAQGEPAPVVEALKPAVPIKKSILPDYIVCLEDGRQFKSLKRHLRTAYDMTPAQYREKWNLPRDYPMVAPNYAAARSRLAKTLGLGQARIAAKAKAAAPAPAAKPARAPRKSKAA